MTDPKDEPMEPNGIYQYNDVEDDVEQRFLKAMKGVPLFLVAEILHRYGELKDERDQKLLDEADIEPPPRG